MGGRHGRGTGRRQGRRQTRRARRWVGKLHTIIIIASAVRQSIKRPPAAARRPAELWSRQAHPRWSAGCQTNCRRLMQSSINKQERETRSIPLSPAAGDAGPLSKLGIAATESAFVGIRQCSVACCVVPRERGPLSSRQNWQRNLVALRPAAKPPGWNWSSSNWTVISTRHGEQHNAAVLRRPQRGRSRCGAPASGAGRPALKQSVSVVRQCYVPKCRKDVKKGRNVLVTGPAGTGMERPARTHPACSPPRLQFMVLALVPAPAPARTTISTGFCTLWGMPV